MNKKSFFLIGVLAAAFILSLLLITQTNNSSSIAAAFPIANTPVPTQIANAPAPTQIGGTYKPVLQVTPITSNKMIHGVPAMKPTKVTDNVTPAFSQAEVIQYVSSNLKTLQPLPSTTPVVIDKVEFITAGELRKLENSGVREGSYEAAEPDDALICVITFHGNFVVGAGGPSSPFDPTNPPNWTPRTFTTGEIEFDAHTGNFLGSGVHR